MSSLKLSSRDRQLPPRPPGAHPVAVLLLRRASAVLAQLARRLAGSPRARPLVQLEYHADAGAPEGALYVDGQLAGWLDGVRRL